MGPRADGLVGTYKAVSSGLPGLSVRYHYRLVNLPEGLEILSEGGVGGVVRQPTDEDLGESGVFLKRCGMHDVQSSVHELVKKHGSAGKKTKDRHTGGQTMRVSPSATLPLPDRFSRKNLMTSGFPSSPLRTSRLVSF